MQQSDYIICEFTTTLWNESHVDHLVGLGAIGNVIKNRVTAGWGTWLEVLGGHEKWSATPQPDRRLKLGDIRDVMFLRLLGLASNIYSGLERDASAGALWYCYLNTASKDFIENIVHKPDEHPRIATVGQISFFR